MSAPTVIESPVEESTAIRLARAMDLGEVEDLTQPTEDQETVAQPAETPEETQETVEAEQEATVEEPAEGEEAEAEAAEEEAEAEPDEEEEISHIRDLAKTFGIEEQEVLEHLQVTVGESDMSLAQVLDLAQAAPLPDQVAAAVRERQEEMHQAEVRRVEQYGATQNELVGLIGVVQAMLQGPQLNDEALAKLKVESPDEWLVRCEERRQLDGFLQKTVQEAIELDKQRIAQAQQVFEDRCIEEARTLIRAVPEWADEAKARPELEAIGAFMRETYGFTQQEIENMPDHRIALMARDAYAGSKQTKQIKTARAKLATKKMRAKTTPIPSQQRRGAEDRGAKARAALIKRQRETARDARHLPENRAASARLMGDYLDDATQ